jgi:2-amino-4-hydroxy-6-hydroxymethyldihydropteridine diphosphokinase
VVDVAYVALGSNVGDRAGYLARARAALAALPESRVLGVTEVEETDPVGPVTQGPYLNQMVALETALAPEELLSRLQDIERAEGRVRIQRWGPRTLDLDIVLYERQRVATATLVVPHPEIDRRDFWRRELDELRTAVRAARERRSEGTREGKA